MIYELGQSQNSIKGGERKEERGGKMVSVTYAVELWLVGLLVRSWVYLSCVGVVAQPWRRAEKLVLSLDLVRPLCSSGG